MNATTLRRFCGLGLLLTGCSTMHIPPPANLGAPLPPAAAAAEGLDVTVGAQTLLHMPFALHLQGAKAMALGDAPLSLELGGNMGTGWAGAHPALHWHPDGKTGSRWAFGGRLGVLAGVGDQLGETNFTDPYLGASLQAQASRVWEDGGAITTALGWGYSGHTRCMAGCRYSEVEPTAENPDPPGHNYVPHNAPSLHLRADMPVGREGYAWTLSLGVQPLIWQQDVLPIFSIHTGLHHKDPGPRW